MSLSNFVLLYFLCFVRFHCVSTHFEWVFNRICIFFRFFTVNTLIFGQKTKNCVVYNEFCVFFRKKRTFCQKMRHFSLKTHYKCIQTPIQASGSKWPIFEGYTPHFGGRTPPEGGSLENPITFEKDPPGGGGPVTPFWGSFLGFPYYFWKSTSPNPIFWKKPSKNRFFTVNTLKNWFLSVISHYFHYKHTQKRFFHCKHTHFWVFWPILGGTPLWGVYTPQKNRQKRTLFKSSQSSYRAKSNQSSSNFMKPQSRALLTRILKGKSAIFPQTFPRKIFPCKF